MIVLLPKNRMPVVSLQRRIDEVKQTVIVLLLYGRERNQTVWLPSFVYPLPPSIGAGSDFW